MRLTLTQQLEAIEKFEKGNNSRECCHRLRQSTFYKILQRKDEIVTEIPNKKGPTIRLNETQEILDKRIHEWYLVARRRNIPISGPMMQ
jgi:hypothetical protein